MKVLLINAPSKYCAYVTSDWDRTAEDIGAFPPIGLSYLAGYLLERTSHKVEILDALAENLDYDQIEKKLLEFKPDVVGTSVFTPTFYDTLTLARLVKKAVSACRVCVGGTQHMRMYLAETLRHKEINFAVRGEGEVVFASLLDALENKIPLTEVSGISYRDGGKIVSQGEEGYIDDVNGFPSPAFKLLPLERYKSAIGTGKTCGTIATSRGCPHECIFCDRPYRSYRSYDNERILSEVGFFYGMGIREIVFFDDMFNLNPERVIDISNGLIERYPGVTWSFRGRVDQVTEEMVLKAKEAGCRQMMFGVEVARDEDFKAIRKKITADQVLNALCICKKAGVETSTNWIIGMPTHKSRGDILDLLDFAIKSGSDYAQFNMLIPYEGTDLYAAGVEKGLLPKDFWKNYVLDPTPNAYVPIWGEHFTREELSELLKLCYRRFYLQPLKIIDHVFRVRSVGHFRMKLKGVMTILGFGGFKRSEVK